MEKIQVYSDGGCRNNNRNEDNIGAWAYLILSSEPEERAEAVYNTTNNQMELLGAIRALERIEALGLKNPIQMNVDSQYVLKGITEWIQGWKRNNWRTANKKPVQNKELWIQLDSLNSKLNVHWNWVKGHSDSVGNIRVDKLLNIAMDTERSGKTL